MTVSLLAPGFIFLFGATVLLIIVSVGAPVWHDVYFLKATLSPAAASALQSALPGSDPSGGLRAGIWGYCVGGTCTGTSLGYTLPGELVGSQDVTIVGSATNALILHPIAAAIAVFALAFALCGNIVTGLLASLGSFIAFIVALAAFIADLVIWITAKHRIQDNTGSSADYGNAFWMTLAATISLLLASFTVCCAHHRSRRSGYYDRSSRADMVETAPRRRWPWQRRNAAAY